MPGIFDPLVPQSWIDPLQRKLEERSLDQSPLEAQIKGFGSGALEGLRGLTSPVGLAGMLPGGAAAKLLRFAPRMAKVAAPVLDQVPEATSIGPVVEGLKRAGSNPILEEAAAEAFRKYARR